MAQDETIFRDALAAAIQPWNLALTPEQVRQLLDHYQGMVETNRVMNLTRITEPAEAAVKHYADSLALTVWARDRGIAVRTVLDIGTGAGFPAIPLAVARPEWQVTAIDGTQKKIDFITSTARTLGLSNLRALHAHSAHWETDERFDVVGVRALGALEKCIESGRRFLCRGGRLAAYKTPSGLASEGAAAASITRRLRLPTEEAFAYRLPLGGEVLDRVLVIYSRAA